MPKINIKKNLSSVEALSLFEALRAALTQDAEVQALEPSLKLECHTEGADQVCGKILGNRIQGNFEISKSGQNTQLHIDLKLPLMLSPFKGLVQKKIESKLEAIVNKTA